MHRMKALVLALWVSVHSVAPACAVNVTGTYGGWAILPCSFADSPVSRVYWQTKNAWGAELVNGFCTPPDSACNDISAKYTGRSNFTGDTDRGNLSLRLFNIRLEDEGRYHCVVQRKGKDPFHCYVNLQVAAQYSQPEVTRPSQKDFPLGEEVNLTCSARGGYPMARVKWINKTSNVQFSDSLVVTQYNGGKYQLNSVISTLRVKASHDPIACQIVNNLTEEFSTSASVQLVAAGAGSSGGLRATGTATENIAPITWCIVFASLSLYSK